MRGIKFRGQRLGDEAWMYGYLYEAQDRAWIICEEGFQAKPDDVNGPAEYDSEPVWFEVDPRTIGQYIGRHDVQGREIFEGDVVHWFDPRKIDWSNPEDGRSVVEFLRGSFVIHREVGPKGSRFETETLYDYLMWREYCEVEVIGNIYETPELLAEKGK